MRRLIALSLAAATALAAGCGGGGGESSAEVEAAVRGSTASNDPADCRRYNTQNSLEQTTKLRGRFAIEGCETVAREDWPLPEKVTISQVDLDGEKATAEVGFEGGAYNGQTLELALVEEGDGWKVDEILGFVELDRAKLVVEWGRLLLSTARSRAEGDMFACVVERLDELDDASMEALVTDSSLQPLLDLIKACEPTSEAI